MIDDVLRREAAQTTELDYTEQTSRMLFLKYLDDLEAERAAEAELRGEAVAGLRWFSSSTLKSARLLPLGADRGRWLASRMPTFLAVPA